MARMIFDRMGLICDAKTNNIVELAEIAAPGDKDFFRGANFHGVDIRGLDLSEFNLAGAAIVGAVLNKNTILPTTNKDALIIFQNLVRSCLGFFDHEGTPSGVSLSFAEKIEFEPDIDDELPDKYLKCVQLLLTNTISIQEKIVLNETSAIARIIKLNLDLRDFIISNTNRIIRLYNAIENKIEIKCFFGEDVTSGDIRLITMQIFLDELFNGLYELLRILGFDRPVSSV